MTDAINIDEQRLVSLREKRFLITGADGMLGVAFRQELGKLVPASKICVTSRVNLDVRNISAFSAYDDFCPDFVIHCAALVDADYCEDHPVDGRLSIVEGTQNVINYAQRHNAFLYYPQSFLIYDGKTRIDEATPPAPLNVYGQLKTQAEALVLDQLPGASLSVRMGGFFGGGEVDDNFVGLITRHLSKLILRGDQEISIGDRIWQPTYTNDLAKNCLLLMSLRLSGIYCMACHGTASFYDLTVEIARILGIEDRIHIGRIDASILAAKELALRPLQAEMTNIRLQNEGLDRQRPWQISLNEYLSSHYFKELF